MARQEERFQVRVAEEAITPQIVSIVIVMWATSFRQASSSRCNGEGSCFGPLPPLPLEIPQPSALPARPLACHADRGSVFRDQLRFDLCPGARPGAPAKFQLV